jgi:uncharacterized protein YbjT (DUF2867 family)
MKIAVIAGATGLIGKQLLSLLLNDPAFSKVKALTRRPLTLKHEKLQNIIIDFDRLEDYSDQLDSDDVFCCLGTTMKKAGSKQTFWRADHDYPLTLAKICIQRGAQQFLLVSALGANKNSSFYYNEVKGSVEIDIDEVGFNSFHIFRPSLLLGPRDEKRSAEDAAKTFYRLFNFLIPLKYKAIDSMKVAKAMLHFSKAGLPGKHVHHSAELQEI